MNIDQEYEEILNMVQRHTMCKEGACLRKKKGRMVCRYFFFTNPNFNIQIEHYFGVIFFKKLFILNHRYNAPWALNLNGSKLYEDIENGEKKIEATRNDDRVNSHNHYILQLWRANIDSRLVFSKYAMIKYIAK